MERLLRVTYTQMTMKGGMVVEEGGEGLPSLIVLLSGEQSHQWGKNSTVSFLVTC